MVQRREFLKAVSLGAVQAMVPGIHGAQSSASSATDKPNILIFISDQHRAGLSKRSGYPLDTSPTLDALAERGVAFDRAYATIPLCMPSRTTMVTGRWPEAHRVRQNSGAKNVIFGKDLFDVVKAQGYRTGLAGKNHTYLKPDKFDFWRHYTHNGGPEPAGKPKIGEFDRWLVRLDSGLSLVPTPFPVETQVCYRIVSDAIEFMERFGDQPFALEVSVPEPHNPEQVPKPYWDMYPPDQVPDRCAGPEALEQKGFRWHWLYGLEKATEGAGYEKHWRRYKSNYLGMLRLLDDQLTRLVSYMRQRNLLEKTVIVYLADHGDYLMDYGLGRKGAGMPEALIRIPMVWSGWGIEGGHPHHPAFVSMADVMPTFCEAIGADIPHGVQGRSLWPILQGKHYPEEEFRSIYAGVGYGGLYYDSSDKVPFSIAQMYAHYKGRALPGEREDFNELNPVTQSGYMKMVRMGQWKLLYDMMGYGQLYNLVSDPCELKNLYGDPSVASIQMQLFEELLMWTIRTEDTLPTAKLEVKWPRHHNWYAPYRHGQSPEAFIP